jgi:hypothetical protein
MTTAVSSYTRQPEQFELFNKRTTFQMIADRVYACIREILFMASTIPSKLLDFCGCNANYHRVSTEYHWKSGNQGLYLLIHGVNGHPSIWDRHLARLRNLEPKAEIRAVHVPLKGNCSLARATEPLLEMVLNYISAHPGNPVCFIGVSNGTRIVSRLAALAGKTGSPIKVSTIAGPLFGSRLMDIADRLHVAQLIYDPEFIKEVKYGSACAKDLIDTMKESPEGTYEFYATMDDSHIVPWVSGLPYLNRQEKVTVVSGYSHNGIVDAVREEQLQSCMSWMKEKRQNHPSDQNNLASR